VLSGGVVWRCCLAVLSGGVVWRCCTVVLDVLREKTFESNIYVVIVAAGLGCYLTRSTSGASEDFTGVAEN
jgi:hypothetical protein